MLQCLDVSACTGARDSVLLSVMSLTQLTALDASCLVRGDPSEESFSIFNTLAPLTGGRSVSSLCLFWQSDSRHAAKCGSLRHVSGKGGGVEDSL